eukprot:8519576-Alexandrium_andersonii.AAC.1
MGAFLGLELDGAFRFIIRGLTLALAATSRMRIVRHSIGKSVLFLLLLVVVVVVGVGGLVLVL